MRSIFPTGPTAGCSPLCGSTSGSDRAGSVPLSNNVNSVQDHLEAQPTSLIQNPAPLELDDHPLWIVSPVGPAVGSILHENTAFGTRTLRYYTRQLSRQFDRQLSPFIHTQHVNQAAPQNPLRMLLSLSKMCEVLTPENEELVYGMVVNESSRLSNLVRPRKSV